MAFSVNSPVGDGVTTQFAVSFTNGLFSRESVYVRVGDELVDRQFTWINDGLIELQGTAPAVGEVATIRRIMDKTQNVVDYSDGEILDEENLDLSNDQLLNICHEFLDGYGLTEVNTDIDMRGNKITNATSDTDDPTSLATIGDIQTAITNPEELQDALRKTENLDDLTNKELAKANLGVVGENLLLNSSFSQNRRKVINGNSELFNFLGAPTNSNYGPDMWAVASGRTIERVFNDNPSYSTSKTSLRAKIAPGSTVTKSQLLTAVELFGTPDASIYSDAFPVGATYTLSFAHKAPAGEDLVVYLSFRDGIGNPGNDVFVHSTTFSSAGTGSWSAERKSVTFTIPNSPAATNQCLEINIAGSILAGGDQSTFIQLADVKLERGSVATPYVVSDRIEEEAKTARYCSENSTGGSAQHTGFIVSSTTAVVMIGTNTKVRTVPTFVTEGGSPVLTLYNAAGVIDQVTPTEVGRYGADLRLTLAKVGGGNLSVTSGACYLQVDGDYILDSSL